MLSLGAVYALFAAYYYWVPAKILGKPYNELLGQIHFWSLSIGVNLTFMPQHFLGLAGMPRRIPDYPDSFEGWNLVSSFGSIISIVATVLFIYIIYDTLAQPEDTLANDPWAVPAFFTSPRGAGITKTATTLEWAITSPPAFHAFEGQLPVQSVNTPLYSTWAPS